MRVTPVVFVFICVGDWWQAVLFAVIFERPVLDSRLSDERTWSVANILWAVRAMYLMLLAAMCCAMYSVATEARDLDVYLSYSTWTLKTCYLLWNVVCSNRIHGILVKLGPRTNVTCNILSWQPCKDALCTCADILLGVGAVAPTPLAKIQCLIGQRTSMQFTNQIG